MHRSTDDGARVVHGLLLLHQAGYSLDPDQLLAAAIQRHWQGSEALILRDAAREVGLGVKKRPRAWYRPRLLGIWEAKAALRTTRAYPQSPGCSHSGSGQTCS